MCQILPVHCFCHEYRKFYIKVLFVMHFIYAGVIDVNERKSTARRASTRNEARKLKRSEGGKTPVEAARRRKTEKRR